MKAINRFFVWIILAISLCAGSAAWAAPSIVGGNVIVNRGSADTFSNFYIMDTNNPFNAKGKLTSWEIYAQNTKPVQLVIYRQQGGVFSVVGKSNVEIPVVGYNKFLLGNTEKIKVAAGDFVGVYHPETGSVSFNLDPPGASSFGAGNLTGTVLFTDINSASPTNFISSSNRHYSIRAIKDKNDNDDNHGNNDNHGNDDNHGHK